MAITLLFQNPNSLRDVEHSRVSGTLHAKQEREADAVQDLALRTPASEESNSEAHACYPLIFLSELQYSVQRCKKVHCSYLKTTPRKWVVLNNVIIIKSRTLQ